MKRIIVLIAMMLVLFVALVACDTANADNKESEQTDLGAESEILESESNSESESISETDAPETDAPETDAPETDAPETDEPEIENPCDNGQHDEEEHEAKPASCTETGWEAYVTCKRDGCDYTTRGEDVPALGHNMQKSADAVEPGCESTGSTELKACANGCGKTEGGETIPAKGHDFVDGECSRCYARNTYKIEIKSNMERALTVTGETSQTVSVENPKMSKVSVSANLGYIYSHYTVNGVKHEGSTIAIENVTEDLEIVLVADYATYELPIITIDTNDRAITSKEDYVDGSVFSVINCGEEFEDILDVTGGIRLRGNSTRGYPKKPYRIKFDKKQSLFGLDKAKSWVLLAEYLDPSALHNYTAFTLANDMDGMGFNPTPIKVNVYLNGRFDGLYTLCEQVQENEGRLGIELDEITEDMVDLKDFNFFIAMDLSCTGDVGAEEDGTYIKIPIPEYAGNEREEEYMIIEMKYPERDQFVSEDQFISYREQLREYMTDLLDALATGDAEYIKQEVNVNSLIDYLLIDQIMDEDDHHFKSFNMYFTNTSDNEAENGKLSFGPVWDYDYSLGVPWTGVPNVHFSLSDRIYFSNIFFRGMMNIPEFAALAAERYENYMRPAVLDFLEGYDALVASMDESVALNQERWYTDPDEIPNMKDSYKAVYLELGDKLSSRNIEFLKASLEHRIELFDKVFIDKTKHIYSKGVCMLCGLDLVTGVHKLGALGQQTITLGENITTPVIDGSISDGEYEWSLKGINESTAAANGTFFTSSNITNCDLYVSCDDTKLYVGAVVTDVGEHKSYINSAWMLLGGGDMCDAWKIYLCKENGTTVEHWNYVDGVAIENTTDNRSDRAPTNFWNPTYHGRDYTFAQSFVDGVYTYEISFDREDWGIDTDEFFFLFGVQSTDGYMIYGYKSKDVDEVYAPIMERAHPHVIEYKHD